MQKTAPGLWQQKQLKTMEISEVCPDLTMTDIYINSNLDPLTKFASCSRTIEFKDIVLWNISQMIITTIPTSTRIVKVCNEARDLALS